jgi:hypothetical protein
MIYATYLRKELKVPLRGRIGLCLVEVAHGPNEVVEIERIYQHVILYTIMAARLLG